ncbi:MAG TPA: nuclear transport factor 2 family protein, partial [Kofleriaceae bacterium]|nr:nuclear transport factor 2 family protein [Kofleriaceae bacterium]
MIDRSFADELAREWIAAWNSHDLERILAHYDDAFSMSSPLIVQRGFDPSGTLRGKEKVRPYWRAGLDATPALNFTLEAVFVGPSSIAILYTNQAGRRTVEVLILDESR